MFQAAHPGLSVVTQNIDGMHQRSGCHDVIELHGSLWRLRCRKHGVREDPGPTYARSHCAECGEWLRPDITWFQDALDPRVLDLASQLMSQCQLLISIGTSSTVWPAAGLPRLAKEAGARCVEINLESTEASSLYDHCLRGTTAGILQSCFF
jgi:NAD-dependent deacetylase